MKKVIIIGPAHPLRGGLASFDERLATQFMNMGFDTEIFTFSLQYPNFLFPGTTQYSTEPAPEKLTIRVCINSINPFNWIKTGFTLYKLKPAIIVFRYWLPFMGPCLGTIAYITRLNKQTKIICIADNVIPHEKRMGDTLFTKYFFGAVDAFVTMSAKVLSDLASFTSKPAKQIVHPLYDNFGAAIHQEEARNYLNLPQQEPIILFFGFIRKYKGLDLLLQAIAMLKNQGKTVPKLLVAGEFYEDRTPYDQLIQELKIEEHLILKTDFIPDSEVKYYLCAADFVIQPYKNATQSGVTPLAYHFEKPMMVTNVGSLPDLVPHQKAGWIAAPNPQSIADAIDSLYQFGQAHFLPFLRSEKRKYSWEILVNTLTELAKQQ